MHTFIYEILYRFVTHLKLKDPMAFTEYRKGMIHMDQPALAAVHFNGFAKLLANEVSKWPELHPR